MDIDKDELKKDTIRTIEKIKASINDDSYYNELKKKILMGHKNDYVSINFEDVGPIDDFIGMLFAKRDSEGNTTYYYNPPKEVLEYITLEHDPNYPDNVGKFIEPAIRMREATIGIETAPPKSSAELRSWSTNKIARFILSEVSDTSILLSCVIGQLEKLGTEDATFAIQELTNIMGSNTGEGQKRKIKESSGLEDVTERFKSMNVTTAATTSKSKKVSPPKKASSPPKKAPPSSPKKDVTRLEKLLETYKKKLKEKQDTSSIADAIARLAKELEISDDEMGVKYDFYGFGRKSLKSNRRRSRVKKTKRTSRMRSRSKKMKRSKMRSRSRARARSRVGMRSRVKMRSKARVGMRSRAKSMINRVKRRSAKVFKNLLRKTSRVKKMFKANRSLKKGGKRRSKRKRNFGSSIYGLQGGLDSGPIYSGVYPMHLKVNETFPNLNNIKRPFMAAFGKRGSKKRKTFGSEKGKVTIKNESPKVYRRGSSDKKVKVESVKKEEEDYTTNPRRSVRKRADTPIGGNASKKEKGNSFGCGCSTGRGFGCGCSLIEDD